MNVLLLLLVIAGLLVWLYTNSKVENFYSASYDQSIELPTDQCIQTTVQSSYQSNKCLLYKRFNAAYSELKKQSAPDSTIKSIVQAYTDSLLQLNGSSFTMQYTDIAKKFISFDLKVKQLFSGKYTLPSTYIFDAPNAISLLDYAPGVASWPTASINPKSYKCMAFNADELTVIDNVTAFVGSDSIKKSYLSNLKANICASKGYYYNDGSYANKGCADCNGCCMPSDDPLPAAQQNGGSDTDTATITCPKPKVRPFKIPGRELNLRIVSPKLKAQIECFVGTTGQFDRDVQQILKSEKFKKLQQLPN